MRVRLVLLLKLTKTRYWKGEKDNLPVFFAPNLKVLLAATFFHLGSSHQINPHIWFGSDFILYELPCRNSFIYLGWAWQNTTTILLMYIQKKKYKYKKTVMLWVFCCSFFPFIYFNIHQSCTPHKTSSLLRRKTESSNHYDVIAILLLVHYHNLQW